MVEDDLDKQQKFAALALRVYKSEGARIAFVVFSVIFLLLFLLPLFLKNDGLKFQLEQKITQISGANFSINGDVQISFVPSLTVIANDAILQNYQAESGKTYNIYAKKLRIKLPILKIFDRRFVKKIILEEALMESFYAASPPPEHDKKFHEETAAKSSSNSLSSVSAKIFPIAQISQEELVKSALPEVEIVDGSAIFYDKLARAKEVKMINLNAQIDQKTWAINGDFLSEDVPSNFRFFGKFSSKSRKDDSFLELTSSALELRAKGKFISENRGIFLSDFTGKIEAEIFDLKSFYKTYFSSQDAVFQKLQNSSKPIKISSQIDARAGEIVLPNVKINSDLLSGDGEIEINLANKFPLIDLALNLDNLVLDGIWSNEMVKVDFSATSVLPALQDKNENVAQDDEEKVDDSQKDEVKKITPIDFDFAEHIRNFDLTAEIKIKNVDYADLQLGNLDCYATISKEGEVMILPLIFNIPQEGRVRIFGVLDNNSQLPKFVGKLDVGGKNFGEILKWMKIESQNLKFENLKNYALYSDLFLLPNSATFSNFYLNLNDGKNEVSGEVKIEDQVKNSKISTSLRINNFAVEDYLLSSGQNVYLSYGSLLKKLLWLNEIPHDNSLLLQFDSLHYKQQELKNQVLKMHFGRGYFALDEFNFNSENNSAKMNFAVDISGKQPRFEMNVLADKIFYETAPAEDQSTLSQIVSAVKKQQRQDIFDRFYSLPSLEDFDGKISFDVALALVDGREVKNFKLLGNLKNGSIDEAQIFADLYSGSLSYQGLLALKLNKTFNGNLTFNNVALQPFLTDVLAIKNLAGLANFSASITSAADNKNDFARNLIGEIKFSVNSPTLDGYGLGDLIKKMFAIQNYRQDLAEPEKIISNLQAQTAFNTASGSLKIAKGSDGKLRCDVAGLAVNGILTGAVDLPNRKIDLLLNSVFLTGNRQKQIPINIATSVKGEGGVFLQSSNLNQVRQYLGLPKLANSELAPVSQNANQDKTVLIPAEKKQ